jgi:hypothetical protein
MDYPRMKHPSEQRDWVRAVDERLPRVIEEACKAQDYAKAAHDYIVWCQSKGLVAKNEMFESRREASAEAIRLLYRVLYYQGMRNANLPRES